MPDTPAPISPAEGTAIDEPSTTFEWSGVDGADNYELQLARDRDFTDIVFRGRVGAKTEFAYSGLPAQEGVSLFWRVRARRSNEDSDAWGEYGPTASFVLTDWQPEQPALAEVAPSDADDSAPAVGASEPSYGPFLLVAFVAISVALTGALFVYVDDASPASSSTATSAPPPDTTSSSMYQYGVVDEEQRVYRIPIDSAMKEVVEARGGEWE